VGESTKDPLKYYDNNIHGLVVLLREMHHHNVTKFVFSSACTVYGIPAPENLPVTEELARERPNSPYGNTKKMCEEIIEDYAASNAALESISLRYFNPVGAHRSSLIGELPI